MLLLQTLQVGGHCRVPDCRLLVCQWTASEHAFPKDLRAGCKQCSSAQVMRSVHTRTWSQQL